MKTLSLVPMIALGSLITFLTIFSPIKNLIPSSAADKTPEIIKKKTFREFLNNFDNIDLPYDIDQSDFMEYVANYKGKNKLYSSDRRIHSEFEAFVPGLGTKFSRVGPNIYLYEAILASSKDAATVIYSSHAPYQDYPEYFMVTYDNFGNISQKTTFAHRSFKQLTIGAIDKTMNVTIKTYTFDYGEEDIRYDKKIDESKLILNKITTLKVTKKGEVPSVTPTQKTTENRAK